MPENMIQLIKYGFALDPFFNHEYMKEKGVKVHYDSKRFHHLCNKYVHEKMLGKVESAVLSNPWSRS